MRQGFADGRRMAKPIPSTRANIDRNCVPVDSHLVLSPLAAWEVHAGERLEHDADPASFWVVVQKRCVGVEAAHQLQRGPEASHKDLPAKQAGDEVLHTHPIARRVHADNV